MPASAHKHRRRQYVPANCTWRLSAPAQRVRSWLPSCIEQPREVVAYGLDRIDPKRDIRIVLVEAAERILPGLPQRISEAAQRLLGQLGVEVRTGARVTKVAADGVRLADGSFIPSELVVWAAGVKAPDVLREL